MEKKSQKEKPNTDKTTTPKTSSKKASADNANTKTQKRNPADVEIVETEEIGEFYDLENFSWDGVSYNTTIPKKFATKKKYELPNPKLIKAFIPGTIKNVFVSDGNKVKKNDKLLVLEAMKMKNNIVSPMQGVIKKVFVKQGDLVTKNEVLIEFA